MFGMSSTDFWENDPQLYWAYRTFYLKKNEMEVELTKYNAWLNGNMQSIGTTIAISQTFGNNKQIQFPDYEKAFSDSPNKKLSKDEAQDYIQEELNYWARR